MRTTFPTPDRRKFRPPDLRFDTADEFRSLDIRSPRAGSLLPFAAWARATDGELALDGLQFLPYGPDAGLRLRFTHPAGPDALRRFAHQLPTARFDTPASGGEFDGELFARCPASLAALTALGDALTRSGFEAVEQSARTVAAVEQGRPGRSGFEVDLGLWFVGDRRRPDRFLADNLRRLGAGFSFDLKGGGW